MKATCWMGKKKIEVHDVPDPQILNQRDAIVKITSTAICGSDLHLYNALTAQTNDRGRTALATAAVLGIGALDVLCSEQLATTAPRVTHPARASGTLQIRKSVTIARPQLHGQMDLF